MKKIGSLITWVLAAAMCIAVAGCTPAKPKGIVEKDGTVNYYDDEGNVIYENMKGWYDLGGKYVFVDRNEGKQVKGSTVNLIDIDEDGFAVMDSYSEEKLPVLVKAREVVDGLREEGMSQDDLLMKCYKFVEDMPYLLKDYPITEHMSEFKCYDAHYANNLLNAYDDQLKLGGDCTSDAACLAYLFDAAGLTDIYYCHTESHAWVRADGRYWDPLYIETKGMEWYDMAEYPEEAQFEVEI